MVVSARGPTVTARVLSILDAFTAEHRELSLSEIARHTDLPLSTAHRLVNELAAWGALERGESGQYGVGLRLWEVASLAVRGLGLRDVALPFLEDLYGATHQNIQLAVLDGTEAVYVERISGRRAVSIRSRAGSRLPLHATGVGLVLLANAPLALRQQVLAGPLARFTAHTITEPVVLRRKLDEVRRRGYAISDRQIETVSQSIAAPVYGSQDYVIAALSIVIPAKSEPNSFLPAVIAAARGTSRALGAPRLSGGRSTFR